MTFRAFWTHTVFDFVMSVLDSRNSSGHLQYSDYPVQVGSSNAVEEGNMLALIEDSSPLDVPCTNVLVTVTSDATSGSSRAFQPTSQFSAWTSEYLGMIKYFRQLNFRRSFDRPKTLATTRVLGFCEIF